MSQRILIKRNSGYVDRLRPYEIILDEKVIGNIQDNQTIELHISEGIHSLQMKIDWCRSNIINFESDKNITEFECGSNLRGFKIIFAIIYVIFLRDQYIWLRQI